MSVSAPAPTKGETMEMNMAIKNIIDNYFHDEESNFLESFEEEPYQGKESFCLRRHHNYYDLLVIIHKGNLDNVTKYLEDLYMQQYDDI